MANIPSTVQSNTWQDAFGNAYTDRNPQNIEELDVLWVKEYGITREAMNTEFLAGLDRSMSILEVGANLGLQLSMLRHMGFENLLGVDVNPYAVRHAKSIHPDADIIRGSALDLPFKGSAFDLVYTSGVLIHISPTDIPKAMDEVYRVSKRYIWGFEYYAPNLAEVEYRGQKGLLWKTDFKKGYTDRFPTLRVVKGQIYPMVGSENVSQMFLLEKTE